MNTTSEKFESVGIEISQPATGHRYGEESLALARAVIVRDGEVIADICSGCGVIGLFVAAANKPKKVYLVEIQPLLSEISRKNIFDNGLQHVVENSNSDYRVFLREHSDELDVIFANPPFFKKGEGRLPEDPQKAIAKHELFGSLEEMFDHSYFALKNGGRLAIVFPVARRQETDQLAAACGFSLLSDHGVCSGGNFFICEYVLKR